MIEVHCFRCSAELNEPGAIIIAPVPGKSSSRDITTFKHHLCIGCWRFLLTQLQTVIQR